jgi:hypothetical protein
MYNGMKKRGIKPIKIAPMNINGKNRMHIFFFELNKPIKYEYIADLVLLNKKYNNRSIKYDIKTVVNYSLSMFLFIF